ncbi:hypothetical protein HMPREF9019_1587 [Hoylesella timonensis CRIS 5C-B1]|uniref:Uncharacterized protein n=1 Tax=Hoylesella timonensis CRIS 5C-B1 TaxID=679189 RepID=D1W1D3_9BACT|nr:hypothetical protein HMPREF9019_1587 [Hoylesella timonensis CRIS 5C-B1]
MFFYKGEIQQFAVLSKIKEKTSEKSAEVRINRKQRMPIFSTPVK